MKIIPYLTGEHANILVKMSFLTFKEVAESEYIPPHKIIKMQKDALICLKVAYGEDYIKNAIPDVKDVLAYMAKRCNNTTDDIKQIMENYIMDYMEERDLEYWKKIECQDQYPTPEELLIYIYKHYDCEIALTPYDFLL